MLINNVRSFKKCGPDRFDVYWIQTDRHRQAKYIYWFLFSAINICFVSNVVLHTKIYNDIYNSRHTFSLLSLTFITPPAYIYSREHKTNHILMLTATVFLAPPPNISIYYIYNISIYYV